MKNLSESLRTRVPQCVFIKSDSRQPLQNAEIGVYVDVHVHVHLLYVCSQKDSDGVWAVSQRIVKINDENMLTQTKKRKKKKEKCH